METTRRFPRTMQEAFGPYSNHDLWEPVEEETIIEKIVVTISFLTAVGVVFAMWWVL